MDWCLDTRVPGALELAADEVMAHLGRHAIEPAVVELAGPLIRDAISGRPAGPMWVSLDWSGHRCLLRICPLSGPGLPGEPLGDGATRAHEVAARLAAELVAQPGEPVGVELGVARTPQRDIDLPPAAADRLPGVDAAHLLGLISDELGAGRSLEEAAARAGSTLAERLADEHGVALDPPGVAARVVEAERRLGADFEVVEADQHRAVLRNRRCPFGPAARPALCRLTSALTGSTAARSGGHADVSVMESLAAGDRECRLAVQMEPGLDQLVAHHYEWPVPDPPDEPALDLSNPRRFQVKLTLLLPRDHLSVPITRHLIRAAMDEVGVLVDDADAVDLAVTEACANVIDHAGPGDAYDVIVTINPMAAHIRVVDVGRGFDHRALFLSKMAEGGAEHGRGLALMHAVVDQVRLESQPERGTVVHLVKRLRFEEGAAAGQLLG
ncbi:MAG: ATP-binding protein [Actinomycetota bacterium]|nr:ATP-binding protein [Actinomycetota bacterium]